MTPIDRVAQRAQAFTVLGVPPAATKSEIRTAFRRLAFETHPDQNPEAGAQFAKISEAYQFLSANASSLAIKDDLPKDQEKRRKSQPRVVSKPTIKAAETVFDQAALAECKETLDAIGGTCAKHVAVSVHRIGRHLTYFVNSTLQSGRNEVAIPTGMLEDSRRVLPKVLAFQSVEVRNGVFDLDSEICAEHFPGARSIKIRFSID